MIKIGPSSVTPEYGPITLSEDKRDENRNHDVEELYRLSPRRLLLSF